MALLGCAAWEKQVPSLKKKKKKLKNPKKEGEKKKRKELTWEKVNSR